MDVFIEVTIDLFKGFGTTCLMFLFTLLLALPLGLVIAFGSMSKFKPLSAVVKVFVWVIRGTPLMLQIMVVFYGPALLGVSFDNRFLACVIAFVINYAAYFSEIYRGGIEGISKGQYEAGQVLGMTKWQIFTKVILFQLIKRITAPMGNEIITLVKDTSLVRIIGVVDIIFMANNAISTYSIIWPLFYTGVFYLAFNGILTLLFGYLEKKMNYYR